MTLQQLQYAAKEEIRREAYLRLARIVALAIFAGLMLAAFLSGGLQ